MLSGDTRYRDAFKHKLTWFSTMPTFSVKLSVLGSVFLSCSLTRLLHSWADSYIKVLNLCSAWIGDWLFDLLYGFRAGVILKQVRLEFPKGEKQYLGECCLCINHIVNLQAITERPSRADITCVNLQWVTGANVLFLHPKKKKKKLMVGPKHWNRVCL